MSGNPSDFRPGERVIAISPLPPLPDLTAVVIPSPFPDWPADAEDADYVWVRFDPPAGGDAHIHRSLLRHATEVAHAPAD